MKCQKSEKKKKNQRGILYSAKIHIFFKKLKQWKDFFRQTKVEGIHGLQTSITLLKEVHLGRKKNDARGNLYL